MYRRNAAVFAAAVFVLIVQQATQAQAPVSPTPIRVQIVTPTPPAAIQDLPSPTFTPTATLEPAAYLEVIPEAEGGINIRSAADLESDILGTARPGEIYVVTGRYFNWYRFRFERSPNGQGWIYADYVQLSGDTSLIPDLSVEPQATVDETVIGMTQTQEIITQTPGAAQTAAAEGQINVQRIGEAAGQIAAVGGALLPTFTPPSDLIQGTASPSPAETIEDRTLTVAITSALEGGIPPIVPIAALAGLGMIGMVISLLRR
jgi:hypothetical protein